MHALDIGQIICVHLYSILMHMCVNITIISGVTNINVAKREQIWLRNLEYSSHDLTLLSGPSYYEG